MKRLLLTFLMAIALVFAINTETKAQSALNVQGGYSWSEGNIGAGYQYKTIEFKAGYMFTKMPGDGSSVSGPVFTFVWGPERIWILFKLLMEQRSISCTIFL